MNHGKYQNDMDDRGKPDENKASYPDEKDEG